MAEQLRTALALLRRKQVLMETGLSTSTLYQRIRDGRFPKPVKLGPKSVAWRAGDVDRWLENPTGYKAGA